MRNGIHFRKIKVTQIIYRDSVSDFVVFLGLCNNEVMTFKVVFSGVSVGDFLDGRGVVKEDNHGDFIKLDSVRVFIPESHDELVEYIVDLEIPALDTDVAKKVILSLGADPLDVLASPDIHDFSVNGVEVEVLEQLIGALSVVITAYKTDLLFAKTNLSPKIFNSLLKHYGSSFFPVIYNNPYDIIYTVSGVHFDVADLIAEAVDFPLDSPERFEALLYIEIVGYLSNTGSSCVPVDEIVGYFTSGCDLTDKQIKKHLWVLSESSRVVFFVYDDEKYLSLSSDFNVELGIAKHVSRLCDDLTFARKQLDVDGYVKIQSESGLVFTDSQKETFRGVVNANFSIVIGGPGTGKTFTVKHLIAFLLDGGVIDPERIALAAPTGKSANVLSDATGYSVSTVHRFLKYQPETGVFLHDEFFKLDNLDLLVVDEFSMVDMSMSHSLFQAIPSVTQVIILGDTGQLESVGKGSVLRDLISYGGVPVFELSEGKRFSNESDIGISSKDIQNGQPPTVVNRPSGSFFFKKALFVSDIEREILNYIPKCAKLSGVDVLDVQVLAPNVVGRLGSVALSRLIKNCFNPPIEGGSLVLGDKVFNLKDRVVVEKSIYLKDVFNGEVGTIVGLDNERCIVDVQFGTRMVTLEGREVGYLALSYALSVHKSQGSQYSVVIMPFHSSQGRMLYRSIVFTGVTRARSIFVGVGSFDELCRGVFTDLSKNRKTVLTGHLSSLVYRITAFDTLIGE